MNDGTMIYLVHIRVGFGLNGLSCADGSQRSYQSGGRLISPRLSDHTAIALSAAADKTTPPRLARLSLIGFLLCYLQSPRMNFSS